MAQGLDALAADGEGVDLGRRCGSWGRRGLPPEAEAEAEAGGRGSLRLGWCRRDDGHFGRPVLPAQPFPQVARPSPRVPDRQRQRGPAREAAQVHHRWVHRRYGHDVGRGAEDRGRAGRGEEGDLVGVLDDAFQSVLGHQDRRAEVVDEALEDREDLLRGRRVECGGRFVEDEDPRMRGEDRADRDALLLPAGERADGPVAQIGQTQQVQSLLDAAAHHVRGEAQRLHAIGEFVLHGVRHEVGERVLADRPHHVGEFPRLVRTGVPALPP